MLTSSSGFPTTTSQTLQSAKLLNSREQYATCHIRLPDETERLPAIALDGKYYSFFRSLEDVQKTLGLILKLTARGEQVALTKTRRGYVIWVHEPDASPAAPPNARSKTLPPIFGPADCWVISDRQSGYRTCSLKVPDLPDTVPGLADSQKLYSLYRREQDAENVLKLAARLSQRGDEVVLLVSKAGYALCVYEPGATVVS